ncbi:MAG: hypothetical protein ACR2LS_10190 [Thermomicrobiales bacterium]
MTDQRLQPRPCNMPGCRRYAAQGSLVCLPHRKTRTGRQWNATIRRAARDASHGFDQGDDAEAAERFRHRLARGDYHDLFDAPLARILAQAAEHDHLDDELGAVRFALARLLAEETDPRHLALGVTRLVRTSVVTSRERREGRDKQPHPLTEAMTKVLAELDAEEQAVPSSPPDPTFASLAYREDEAS